MKNVMWTASRRAILAALIAGAAGSSALAQDASTVQDQSSEVDEIVVTGVRLQNQKAITERRNNLQVTDSVTSDDVGRLPDFNIGEALQRLPGVAVQNDQGEARFVTVRALNANYNYTLVDGVSIAVPDRNGRRVFMDVMPASLADRIDVYKTFTPDLEGGAIGGVIDIRTASAFDRRSRDLNVSAQIGQYENHEGFEGAGPSGTFDARYIRTFGDADQFGVVLFGNYYKRDSYSGQTEYGSSRYFYTAAGASAGQPGANTGVYPGTGVAVPGERRWFYYHNDRTRYGGGAKLEYRPSDDDYLFVRGFWNTATDNEARQTDLLTHSGGGTLTNQTPTSGELRGASGLSIQENLGQFDFERSVWALTGGGDHAAGGGDLSWRLNYSGSYFNNPENWAEWRQNGSAAAFAYQQVGDHFVFTPLNPAAFNNYAAYAPYRRQFDNRELNEDLYEAKVDFGRELVALGAGWRFKVGAGVRRIERAFDESRDRYLPLAGNTYNLLAAGVLRPDLCLRPPGAGAGQCMVAIDTGRAQTAFDAHLAANPGQWRLDTMTNDDNNLDYSLEETVWNAFGLLAYSDAVWSLNLGARYEDTRTDGRGQRLVANVWEGVENSGGFEDLLPSINLGYNLTHTIKLRSAYSKSIGRVPFNAIAPVGERLTEDGSDIRLTRSNPDLLPRRADNIDLAIDWYPGRGRNLLSASLFYKRVENEFFTSVDRMMIDLDGRQVEAQVTQPKNAGSPVDIYGVELNLIQELDDLLPQVLKGFTATANLTLLDTNFKQLMNDGSEVELKTMIGQPQTTYNLALSYDRGPVSARLAYNYAGERLSERLNTTSAFRNRYDGETQSLAFKARYRLSDNWTASFTASNITGEGRTEWIGWDQELPMVAADYGAAYFVGFTFRY
jgi:TonB-dependent receptor